MKRTTLFCFSILVMFLTVVDFVNALPPNCYSCTSNEECQGGLSNEAKYCKETLSVTYHPNGSKTYDLSCVTWGNCGS